MGRIERIVVRGVSDPTRFAGFPDMNSRLNWLESQYGGRGSDQHDSEAPIDENAVAYEIEPDTETLIGSPEFQKLNQALKALVFKDPGLTRAFADFIRAGGRFVIDNSVTQATYDRAYPPTITLRHVDLNPTDVHVGGAFFVLAHEIYHHSDSTLPPPGTPINREAWAQNEAMATFLAYKTLERVGVSQPAGLGFEAQAAYGLVKNSSSDEQAMEALRQHYRDRYPGVD